LVSHAVALPTLLIIAERDDVRSALAHTVRLYGVRQVQTAADAQASALASRIIPDVIVISADHHPDKQVATIRDLRTNLITRHTPIVARVAQPSQSITDSLRAAGADRVVVAPSENSTLINTIVRLSDVSRCRHSNRLLNLP